MSSIAVPFHQDLVSVRLPAFSLAYKYDKATGQIAFCRKVVGSNARDQLDAAVKEGFTSLATRLPMYPLDADGVSKEHIVDYYEIALVDSSYVVRPTLTSEIRKRVSA